jgi:hypothetical protein
MKNKRFLSVLVPSMEIKRPSSNVTDNIGYFNWKLWQLHLTTMFIGRRAPLCPQLLVQRGSPGYQSQTDKNLDSHFPTSSAIAGRIYTVNTNWSHGFRQELFGWGGGGQKFAYKHAFKQSVFWFDSVSSRRRYRNAYHQNMIFGLRDEKS